MNRITFCFVITYISIIYISIIILREYEYL